MKFSCKSDGAKLAKSDLLVVFCVERKSPGLPAGTKLQSTGFSGEFRETRQCDATGGSSSRVLLVGLGKQKDADCEKLRRAAAVAVKNAEIMKCGSVTMLMPTNVLGGLECDANAGRALAEGAIMGAYKYIGGKSKKPEINVKSVSLIGGGRDFTKGAKIGQALGEANCFTRDLQNRPGNEMTPTQMAKEAKKIATKSSRLSCKVLSEADMKKLGMGLLLGVSRGSSEPAKLIHLVYKPKGKSKGKLCMVGKGLTFDAGGISLKPSPKMEDMRYDMSGGAAVLGLFHALTRLDVQYEVHGVVPSSENLPDGMATKPGDIHTAMNGTTVEVLNTDAEGRLILADALCYVVKKIKPERILDLATLTGAVVVALGHEASGIFPTTDKLRDDLIAAGKFCAEPVWPLPLYETHKKEMRGVVADLKNISSPGMGAGSSSGAAFLSNFVEDTEWCHLDIAGAAWGGSNRDWVGGPTGSGVGTRLLYRYLEAL